MWIRQRIEKKEMSTNRQYRKRKSRQNYSSPGILDNKRNSNRFWETVRSARQKRKKEPEIDIKIWQNHFQFILGQVEKHDRSQTHSKDEVQCGNSERFIPELDNPITEQEVRQAIKNLKTGKASGLDNICTEFLKKLQKILLCLFSQNYLTNFMIRVISL